MNHSICSPTTSAAQRVTFMRMLVLVLLMAPLFGAGLMAQAPGDGYYRLKTMFRGEGECLEGNQAASKVHNGAAFMDKCQNVTGQMWKFEDAGNGYYRMKNKFRGEGECLEGNQAGSDVHNGSAFMDKCQNVSGQLWKLEPAGNGYYRLKTKFRGNGECLEGNQATSSTHGGNAFMDKCQNVSGQLWKLEPINKGKVDAAPKTTVKVLSATWGVKGRTANVTNRVQELWNTGESKFEVRNHILNADPAKGVHKSLTVVYSKNGVKTSKTVTERGYFEF